MLLVSDNIHPRIVIKFMKILRIVSSNCLPKTQRIVSCNYFPKKQKKNSYKHKEWEVKPLHKECEKNKKKVGWFLVLCKYRLKP